MKISAEYSQPILLPSICSVSQCSDGANGTVLVARRRGRARSVRCLVFHVENVENTLERDILIVAGSVSGLTPSLEFLLNNKLLKDLTAVRNEHIVVLPSTLFSANSQHLLTAAERLGAAVEALPTAKK